MTFRRPTYDHHSPPTTHPPSLNIHHSRPTAHRLQGAEREAAELTSTDANGSVSGAVSGGGTGGGADEVASTAQGAGQAAKATPNRRGTIERFVARGGGGGDGAEGGTSEVKSRYELSIERCISTRQSSCISLLFWNLAISDL